METTWIETVLYIAFGLMAIAGAAGVILSRNVIYSALCMLTNFCALGALYIMLSAEFLGIVQWIVYAGAIAVLFLFSLMFVGVRKPVTEQAFKPFLNVLAMGLSVLLLTELMYLFLSTGIVGRMGLVTPQMIGQIGSVQILGQALFTDYVLPFELASILLLVGIVGVVALARPKQQS